MKLRFTGGDRQKYNINTKAGLFGWLVQEIGKLILYIICTVIFILIVYMLIITSVMTKFWFVIILAVIYAGCLLSGIASIIIKICNIVYLIHELNDDDNKY